MKSFNYFLEKGDVRKAYRDVNLARSLLSSMKNRSDFIFKLPLDDKSAVIIFENVYDSIRESIDAILSLDSFKSYSHEAPIAYLKNFKEISEYEISELDNFRKIRNKSKYEGKSPTKEDAKRIKIVFSIINKKLLNIIWKKLKEAK